MLSVLIMAGGKGTRFWPLSTEDKPKQFLKLINERTMIQMTVDRIKELIPIERIFVCTGEKYVEIVKEQLPELPERNIIVEPEGRNTAPCIALSAFMINRIYKDTNMLVLPSDHLIKKEDEFRKIVTVADKFVQENKRAIVTIGITPTRAETGYGYIKYENQDKPLDDINHNVIKVESFVEKPDLETAQKYIDNGHYLWNGGMFLWNISSILEKIKEYLPDTYEALHNIENCETGVLQNLINENYKFTDSISIDYGILEKDNQIYVIPSEIDWDDIGSWEAISRYREKDTKGNINIGNILELNSENNLVVSSKNQVIVDNLKDIYVIENNGKIIVGKIDNISNIKNLKEYV